MASTLSSAYSIDIATGKTSEIQVQFLNNLYRIFSLLTIAFSCSLLQIRRYGQFDIYHNNLTISVLQEVMAI